MISPRLRKPDARRGISIIETVVLMTAAAAMLGMCALLLALAMRLESQGRSRIDREASLARLGRLFRADVHDARRVDLQPAGAGGASALRIQAGAGREVEYRSERPGELVRSLKAEGKSAREAFTLPQAAVRMDLRDADGRRFAVLAVDTISYPNRIDPVKTFETTALVGKDVPAPGPEKPGGGRP